MKGRLSKDCDRDSKYGLESLPVHHLRVNLMVPKQGNGEESI